MSKAILVMDMPEKCSDCNLCNIYEECAGKNFENINADIEKEKSADCPLKPIPERMELDEMPSRYAIGYMNGWNGCIESILKE